MAGIVCYGSVAAVLASIMTLLRQNMEQRNPSCIFIPLNKVVGIWRGRIRRSGKKHQVKNFGDFAAMNQAKRDKVGGFLERSILGDCDIWNHVPVLVIHGDVHGKKTAIVLLRGSVKPLVTAGGTQLLYDTRYH